MSTFLTSRVADLQLSSVDYRYEPTGSSVRVTFDGGDPNGFAPGITVFLEIDVAQQLLAGLAVALGEHAIAARALKVGAPWTAA